MRTAQRKRRLPGSPRKAVARSPKIMRALLEQCRDAILVSDSAGWVEYVTHRAEDLWGAPSGGMVGRNLRDLFSARFEFLAWLQNGNREHHGASVEALGLRGERFLTDVSADRLELDGEPYLMLQVSPVIEPGLAAEHQTQERIFDALEDMSLGMAHELNNLLTGILGNLHLALEAQRHRGQVPADLLESACKSALRTRLLTRDLLEFGAGEPGEPSACSCAGMIEDAWTMTLQETSVERSFQFDDELLAVRADPAQLGQIFYQLGAFAASSLPPNGQIRVLGENYETSTASPALLAGSYVKITFELTGGAFLADEVPRLFHPYTSPGGGSAGLTLATVWALVRRQGGALTAEASERGGVRLKLYLPSFGDVSAASIGALEPPIEPHGVARVLVMDDQPDVATVLQRALESLGHRVMTCRDGMEACSYYADGLRTGDPFHVVFLDLQIPGGIGGAETCAALLDLDPEAVCVALSGDGSDRAMSDGGAFGFQGRLQKPFDLDEVEELVARLARIEPPEETETVEFPAVEPDVEDSTILRVDFSHPPGA